MHKQQNSIAVAESPSLGHRCDVVVRSLIATKAGDRGKPNRRDSTMLARLIGPGR
jgi:hypothetical protein